MNWELVAATALTLIKCVALATCAGVAAYYILGAM